MGKQEYLNDVKLYGSLLLTYEEVSILTGIDVEELANPELDFFQEYHKGRLETEMEIRKSILDAAKNGSPDAELKALQMIKSLKTTNLRYE